VFSVNLQRAESFSHHRIGIDNKDSHEHLVDSKELQETSIAPTDTQSDEQVDSEEEKIVKRHVLLQPSTGHSSEEEDTTTDSKNQSIEDSVDSKEIKLVKRDVQFTTTTDGHSSEEDVTTVPTISLEDLSVEDDVDDAEDKKKVKRNVQVEMTSIDHSSEEERYAAIVGQMNQSDEHDYDDSAELFKREIHQLTAGELEMLFQLFHSEGYAAVNGTLIGSHSDEHYFGPIEKRQSGLLATTTGGRSSEEMDNRFDHSFENSMEDVLERLTLVKSAA
jgi:hypothetical protein